MSRVKLQRRLRELEQRPRLARRTRRSTWDLACFTDAELELMTPLSAKYEATGAATVWTETELAALERLTRVEQQCRSRA